jgi:hypothetical protein
MFLNRRNIIPGGGGKNILGKSYPPRGKIFLVNSYREVRLF